MMSTFSLCRYVRCLVAAVLWLVAGPAYASIGQEYPSDLSQSSLPLFPGVRHMTTTFNPSNLDVLAPPQTPSYPAIALTFAKNQTIRGLNGQLYSYPDQLILESAPYGSCSAVSLFHASALNFSEAYSQSISVTTSSFFGLFSSGTSSTVAEALNFQSQNQAAVGVTFCPVSTYTFRVQPPIFLLTVKDLDPQFVEGVRVLLSPNPSYSESVGNWTEFFSYWGMGQPQSGTLGGVVGAIWALEMATFQQGGSVWASEQAAAELNFFLGGINGGGGGSGASSLFLSASAAVGGNKTAWAGGSCIPPSQSCSFSDWYQTVFDSPALMSTHWVPLTDYIRVVDPKAADGSEDAIRNITAVNLLQQTLLPLMNDLSNSIWNSIQIPATSNSSCLAQNACCMVVYWGNTPQRYCDSQVVNDLFPGQMHQGSFASNFSNANAIIAQAFANRVAAPIAIASAIVTETTTTQLISPQQFYTFLAIMAELQNIYASEIVSCQVSASGGSCPSCVSPSCNDYSVAGTRREQDRFVWKCCGNPIPCSPETLAVPKALLSS